VQLVNDFVVDAPLETAWSVLTDVPQVVECIPGAELESTSGDDYHAKRDGQGRTRRADADRDCDHQSARDDAGYQMVVRGTGRDRKGNGSVEATITVVAQDPRRAHGGHPDQPISNSAAASRSSEAASSLR